MCGPRRLCHPSGVKPELRWIAVLAAFSIGPALKAAGYAVPVIKITDPYEATVEAAEPPLSISIPKYTLSASEREILAMCLVLEAASQGDYGMRGVMAVVRNRAKGQSELFVPTVLRAKQFSALNRYTAGRETLAQCLARAKHDPMWEPALAVVDDATTETWYDPTEGATHYTRTGEPIAWTRRLAKTVTIGRHSFYR